MTKQAAQTAAITHFFTVKASFLVLLLLLYGNSACFSQNYIYNDSDTEAFLLQSLKEQPDNGDILYNLGIYYSQQGSFEKAVDCFYAALTINPRDAWAYYKLGSILRGQNKHNLAMHYIEKCVELMPNVSAFWLELAMIKNDTAKYKEAITCLERCLSLSEPNGQAAVVYYIGILHLSLRNKEAALLCAKQLEALNKEFAASLKALAELN